jgi:phosphate-selective porin OprO/OprP
MLVAHPARSEPTVRPTLLAEADARAFRAPVEGRTGFALARFRPGAVFQPLSWFRAAGTVELVPTPTILDAFANLRVSEWLDVEIGQSRPPLFASFRYQQVHTLPFPDRAPLVLAMRVRRDVGISAHLAHARVPFESWIRIGSGSGNNVTRAASRPALYGLFDLVLGRANAGATGNELLGLRAGVSGMTEIVDEREGISGISPTGFVYHRPVIASGPRVVGEAHVISYVGPVRGTFEAAVGREARALDADGNPETARAPLPSVTSSGISAELAWTLRGRPRTVGRAPIAEDDSSLGALELAARYDALALGRGTPDVVGGGYRGGALSLKWYALPFAALTAAGYAGVYDVGPLEDPQRTDTYTFLLRASFYWIPLGTLNQRPAAVPTPR